MTEVERVHIITDARYRLHDTGGGEHPEVPRRLQVIETALAGAEDFSCSFHTPRPADRDELTVFHPESWLFRFEEAVLSGRTWIDHPDNQIGYESYTIALLSAGAGLVGVDRVEAQPGVPVFCLIRPPGHHAEPERPYGFCFFNNCVIAARYWQNRYNRGRVCILDFDAHHGNGIQTAFEEDSESLYISIHEHPSFSYPGTGWENERGFGAGAGTILNLPLPPGAGDTQVLALLDGPVAERLEAFAPEVLVIAAGFDAHVEDDMSGLCFSTGLYELIGSRLAGWARQYCSGRMVNILEGGYHLPVLGQSVAAYLRGLLSPLR